MTSWSPDLATEQTPIHRHRRCNCGDLKSGRLKVGDRLPPQRQLAWQLGVTLGTITRAYQEAERRGLLSGEVGRGSYLRSPEPDIPIIVDSADPAMLDMQVSSPPRVIRKAEFEAGLQEIVASIKLAGSLFDYPSTAGRDSQRAACATMAKAVRCKCLARPADAGSRRASRARHLFFDLRPTLATGF